MDTILQSENDISSQKSNEKNRKRKKIIDVKNPDDYGKLLNKTCVDFQKGEVDCSYVEKIGYLAQTARGFFNDQYQKREVELIIETFMSSVRRELFFLRKEFLESIASYFDEKSLNEIYFSLGSKTEKILKKWDEKRDSVFSDVSKKTKLKIKDPKPTHDEFVIEQIKEFYFYLSVEKKKELYDFICKNHW